MAGAGVFPVDVCYGGQGDGDVVVCSVESDRGPGEARKVDCCDGHWQVGCWVGDVGNVDRGGGCGLVHRHVLSEANGGQGAEEDEWVHFVVGSVCVVVI